MSKYGFDDNELQKLFAEAGAAVKKVQSSPSKTSEQPPVKGDSAEELQKSQISKSEINMPDTPKVEAFKTEIQKTELPLHKEEPPKETSHAPSESGFDFEEEDSFIPAFETVKPPPPKKLEAVRAIQLIGGTLAEDGFSAISAEKAPVSVKWKGIQKLALGRVADSQIVAWLSANMVFYISDKNVAFKGLISQMAPSATQNWRTLLSDISTKTDLKNDPGIEALSVPGGLIPKYTSMDEFFHHLKSL